jgi:putative transposase
MSREIHVRFCERPGARFPGPTLLIILNEWHLKRLMASYLLYYHEDRTHLGLAKDTPAGRVTEIRSEPGSKIQSLPRLGGLHHRYAVAA